MSRVRARTSFTALLLALLIGAGALSQAQTAGRPIRLTSWAVSMANVATGANAVVDIRVDKWSTAKERQQLFQAVRNQPRTVDDPFTFIDIRLNQNGEGEGKMAVATQLGFDKKKNTIVFENYSTEPVRLTNVKTTSKDK